ncbi:HDIG domain-containing protein [Alicyclobacillus tolerans]|uniref:HD family phosphohydrolase n=1 Tax=Alicyclobacillus tolerans TaxID=90970 RepID=UPI001F1D9902|nr:HDIG domain-containing metalloprotein [Alicyclobacillus tolerans]MCF8563338.1 HDIG domain-containing protein [Alicyclobacillus tolerans]
MLAKWSHAIRQLLDDPRFRNSRRVRLALYIGLAVVLFFILLGSVMPPRYDFSVGQTSPVTIRAPITAVDTVATQAARQVAMSKVPKQYAQSPAVEDQALAQLNQLFTTATSVVSDKSLSSTQKLESLLANAPKGVSNSTLQALMAMNVQQIGILQSVSDRIVQDLLGSPFYQESTSQATSQVDSKLINFDLDPVSRLVVQDVVVSVLKPNMVYQKAATEAAQQAAAKSVGPVMIHQGDVIVSKNGIITSTVQSRLKDVGLYSSQPNYGMIVGFMLLMGISVALLAAYIERRPPRRRLDNLMLLITGLILILMAVMIAITKSVMNAGGPASIAYLMPVAVGSMLITVLMDSSLAVVSSFYVSLLFAAALNFDYWFTFISVVSSLVGAYSVGKVTHRGTFMRAGFLVAGTNVVSIVAMHLLQTDNGANFQSFSLHVGLGAFNGIITAILTMGILPFFENAFGLLTAIRLLELSNPNNPLLKKVLMEAPGTYHHSLIVGNLAEAAAELVGADPLICRVGAYYHDVGKTRRPMFFIENQMTKENPHDKIAPSLSHLIITSHVTDGLEMLEKAGLPKPIRDICATHHGTTILWYFYNKAKELDKNGTVKVDDFRYLGPKPKTRENAIVMICDAVEAAVRSMSRPTPNRVEGVIRKIIRDRLQDGQLDECDLTLQDLDVMVGAFMKTLKGIYHSRIEYPDPDKIRKEVAK